MPIRDNRFPPWIGDLHGSRRHAHSKGQAQKVGLLVEVELVSLFHHIGIVCHVILIARVGHLGTCGHFSNENDADPKKHMLMVKGSESIQKYF